MGKLGFGICLLLLQFQFSYVLGLHYYEEDLKTSFYRSTDNVASVPDPEPYPYIPLLSPTPLVSSINRTVPELSGFCELNFSAIESIIERTATNCWDSFGSYLANALCCPQLDATIIILVGQWSKTSGELVLNDTHSRHCQQDLKTILDSQGAYNKLDELCSNNTFAFDGNSCPVTYINKFEEIVDSNNLLNVCGTIDLGTECCKRTCQSAILNASMEIMSLSSLNPNDTLELSTRIDSCKNVVIGWLASKLDPSSANSVLRGISSCKMNEVCPLELPYVSNATLECQNVTRNQTDCCMAMTKIMRNLQNQSFITTSQASNCAALLGLKLQNVNVTDNVFDKCNIRLKDFSLQDSGCLLPNSPSDATYDQTSGIGFVCDQNEDITASWPTVSYSPSSSCIKDGVQLPASDHISGSEHAGIHGEQVKLTLICLILTVTHLMLSCLL